MKNENRDNGSKMRSSSKYPLPLYIYTLNQTIVRGGERGRTSREARNAVFCVSSKFGEA